MRLVHRLVGVAVDGGRRRVDDLADAGVLRRLEDVERADDVHVETEARLLDRGPERKHRHVEDTVDPLDHPPKAFDVGDVTLDELDDT